MNRFFLAAATLVLSAPVLDATDPAPAEPTLRVAVAAATPGPNGAPRDLARALKAQRVSVDFLDVPLSEALAQIGAEWSLNLVLTAPLRERADDLVTLQLKNVSKLQVLRFLARTFDFTILQDRHGLLIATTKEDAVKRSMVLKFYDVRLQLFAPTSFPGPELGGLRPSTHFEDEPPPREIPGEGWGPRRAGRSPAHGRRRRGRLVLRRRLHPHLRWNAGRQAHTNRATQDRDRAVAALKRFELRSGSGAMGMRGAPPTAPLGAPDHASQSCITSPWTSVRRMSRPEARKVSWVWSKPRRWSMVAWRSWISARSWTAL